MPHAYNNIADKLLLDLGLNSDGLENNPYFVNRHPELYFRNMPGDIWWTENGIRTFAYIDYKIQNPQGKFSDTRKFLPTNSICPYSPARISATKEKMPYCIIMPANFLPESVSEGELTIEMRRMFEFRIWNRIWSGSKWVWGSHLTLPKEMLLIGKARIRVKN